MEVRKLCVHPYCIKGIEDDELPDFGDHIIEKSSKLKVLDKMLSKMKGKHKVLIFSQFKIMLNILEDYCVYRDHEFRRIDGDYEIEDRQNSIEEFQDKNSDIFVFLLSTRAGGLGITLTASDTVIIYDSDWNP